jgi:hypothetical protein
VAEEINRLRKQLIDNRAKIGGYRSFAVRAGLGESWLYKFVQGRIPDPGATMLAKLRRGLAELPD